MSEKDLEKSKTGTSENDENEDNNEPLTGKIVRKLESKDPDIFKGVKEKEKLVKAVLTILTSNEVTISHEYEEHHEGPLPSPQTLSGYNNVVENGAERIMKVFEKQSSHRMEMEKTIVRRQTFQSQFGQILGFLIAIVCLVLGVYLVLQDYVAAGITLFSLDIVGLAYIFVKGTRRQVNDDEN